MGTDFSIFRQLDLTQRIRPDFMVTDQADHNSTQGAIIELSDELVEFI